MYSVIYLFLAALFVGVTGYNEKSSEIQKNGYFQSSLMPQELNPAYASDKDAAWKIDRLVQPNIESELLQDILPANFTFNWLKKCTRILVGVVLAVSATIEIVLYIIESYAV